MGFNNFIAINGLPYDGFLDGLYNGGEYGVSKAGSIGIDQQGNVFSRKGVSEADRRLLQLKYKKEYDPKNRVIYETEERRLRRQNPNSIVTADSPLSDYMIADNPYQMFGGLNSSATLPISLLQSPAKANTSFSAEKPFGKKVVEGVSNTVKGGAPSTTVINPLQTNQTNIGYRIIDKISEDGIKVKKHQLYNINTNERLFQVDLHNFTRKKSARFPI